jgi:hypothetical protein
MVDRIEAWLRMRDAARFRRDADSAAEGVENIGDSADKADRKLALLNKRTKGSKSAFDELGLTVNNVSGRLKIAAGAALVLGPSIVAIASSAASAAAGLGLIGAAAGGAAAVGLLGLGLVTKQALGGLDKIKSAQDAYDLALAEHGKYSDEALNAQEKLNAVIGVNGGQAVYKFLQSWKELQSNFAKGTKGARSDALGGITDAMGAASRLLPAFTRETNKTAATVRKELAPALAQLSGPEVQHAIGWLSQTFRRAFGPVLRGGVDIFIGLLRYIRQAAPWVVTAAKGFEDTAHSFRQTSSDGTKVNGTVSMLIGHMLAWWGLGKAVFRVMKDIWADSNASGGRLVTSLTSIVNRFAAWIEAGNGTDFFAKWTGTLRSIGSALLPLIPVLAALASAILPALQSSAGGVGTVLGLLSLEAQALAKIIQFLGPAAGPLIVALVALKLVTLGWAAATELANIAMRMTPLGWIVTGIMLLIAAVALIIKHWGWFKQAGTDAWNWIKNAAANAWNWIKDHWTILPKIILGPFGLVASAIMKHFDAIKGAFTSVYNWIVSKWNDFHIGFGGVKIKGHTVIPGFDIQTPDLPLLASGGMINPGGVAIVGDQGPEIASNDGRRTTVTPLNRGPKGAPGAMAGALKFHFEIPVVVAGREIARATADETSDWNARKGR